MDVWMRRMDTFIHIFVVVVLVVVRRLVGYGDGMSQPELRGFFVVLLPACAALILPPHPLRVATNRPASSSYASFRAALPLVFFRERFEPIWWRFCIPILVVVFSFFSFISFFPRFVSIFLNIIMLNFAYLFLRILWVAGVFWKQDFRNWRSLGFPSSSSWISRICSVVVFLLWSR